VGGTNVAFATLPASYFGITLDEAKELQYREVLVDQRGRRWYVQAVKTWKLPKNAHRIKVSLKHGLYVYDSITEADFRNGVCTLLRKEL
jgi:hypothetical protein